jgi:hypothetical protein
MNLEIFNHFFNDNDLLKIKTLCEAAHKDADIQAKGAWQSNLTLGRGNIDIYHITENYDSEVYEIVVDRLKKITDLVPSMLAFYYWHPESFISWHSDDIHAGGATIYLNETWDKDNGGLFLYRENIDPIKGVIPKLNRCVFQTGGLPHTTTSTHWNSPIRKSMQVFFKK